MTEPKPVTTLAELADAAEKRQSVVCPSASVWRKPRPAAFMIHLPGAVLIRALSIGMYIYQPKGKTDDQ